VKKLIDFSVTFGILLSLAWHTVYAAEIVVQPGPGAGKDIWTTSVFSYTGAGGGPGGGLDDEWLQVGGWGDLYYSLIQFNLTGLPQTALSARIEFFVGQSKGTGTTGMYLDRITAFWDWRTQGTGSDRLRLWWADRPPAVQWIPDALPAPTVGQWYSIDITDLYNAWQNGTYPNYGVQLRPVLNDNQWNEFFSSDYTGDPTLRPKLVVQTIAIPQITSISPASGSVGTVVTITGTNFGTTQGTSSVSFSTTAATVSSWSDTQIIATVPTLSAGTYNVAVTTSAGSSNLVSFQIISSSILGLFASNNSSPTHPLSIIYKYLERTNNRIVADVTIINLVGTWYEVDINFTNPSAIAPFPVSVNEQKIPSVFLLGPFQQETFTRVEFREGEYLHFDVLRTSFRTYLVLAIDLIGRGIFGVELPTFSGSGFITQKRHLSGLKRGIRLPCGLLPVASSHCAPLDSS
jgi:hypothetical protein